MSAMASQIAGICIVCLAVCWDADHRKHQRSASLAFLGGIHLRPLESRHKGPVTRTMFQFYDVIIIPTTKLQQHPISNWIQLCCDRDDWRNSVLQYAVPLAPKGIFIACVTLLGMYGTVPSRMPYRIERINMMILMTDGMMYYNI